MTVLLFVARTGGIIPIVECRRQLLSVDPDEDGPSGLDPDDKMQPVD